jgi:hypothetical protein
MRTFTRIRLCRDKPKQPNKQKILMKHVLTKKLTGVATLMALTCAASAQILYVDATHGAGGNTTSNLFAQWDPITGGGQGVTGDTLWAQRTGFGSHSSIYQNTPNSSSDDAHRLVTTISGLASGTYAVYAYFWSDSSSWRMQAALTDNPGGDLPLYISPGAVSGTPPLTRALAAEITGTSGLVTDALGQLTDSSNRRFWQISLGEVTGTGFSVYIDDGPAANSNSRTWYDGVGYAVVPEPSALALLGLGLGALLLRHRANR